MRAVAFLRGRGTLTNPGLDLTRLPIGLDPRGLSLLDGIRAALAFGLVILLHEWVAWPPLLTVALAANLACFADAGGPMRSRLLVLTLFSLLGGVIWGLFGLMQPLGPGPVVPLAGIVIFACTYARVWGVQAQSAGNVLVLVLCFALDRPLSPDQALVAGLVFSAGGLWATLLALLLWRLHPYRPTHRAVAEVWRRLTRLCDDLEDLASPASPETPGTRAMPQDGHRQTSNIKTSDIKTSDIQTSDIQTSDPHASDLQIYDPQIIDHQAFDRHARAHRRGVREAIEQARTVIVDLARSRERISDRTAQALIRLEAAEQIFAALIAVSDLIESEPDPRRRRMVRRFLRRLRPLLGVIARAIRDDSVVDLARLERAMDRSTRRLAHDRSLHELATRILDRVRIGAKLSTPDGYRPGGALLGRASLPLGTRLREPLATNFTLASANLRHAVRATVVAAPALWATLVWSGPFAHWLTITVVLTMQPFYAATWQRALERIGGTVLGGLIGAALAGVATTPLALAALVFPLSIVGFAARQVSYGVFIACLTPLVVLLVEVIEPGHGSWEVVGMRALLTLLGGAIAVASALVLWPIWEPDQVRLELRKAVRAHAAFARAVLCAGPEAEASGLRAQASRGAGLALNDLEAALARALQQPRAGRHPQVESAMVADATLRRISARLTALRYAVETAEPEALAAWSGWVTVALSSLGGDGAMPPMPTAPRSDGLSRLVAQVELLAETLNPSTRRGAETPTPQILPGH
ncbi:cyclic nucleotide-binding protein [Methylobacterium sp. Leaf113]|uniref:FUSC family protein n=1 Tax=Methylobacterium sp. Leaf113 TaxID=1736259 RepID=UPI0006F40C2E|nr:FUSC family protein [Methylobacterium sp. Leaf113]KQP93202.1 cyclic nucleotide-binding protein [Methylobacterium sp. Leaf113]